MNNNNTSPTHEVPDIALLTRFPLDYATEAFVLLRRLTDTKPMMSDATSSQRIQLPDVQSRLDVITRLSRIDPSASSCFTAVEPERDEYEDEVQQ